MADIERMKRALVNADKAGDTAAAKQIANALKAAMAQQGNGRVAMAEMSAATQSLGGAGQDANIRANMDATRVENAMRDTGQTGAMGDMVQSSNPLLGWTDELYSATVGAPKRMMTEGVGYGEGYQREQMMQEELQRRRDERSPIASLGGKVGSGLATGGTLAKGGATLMGGRLGNVAAGTLEGGAYGAVQGGGDAPMGEKAMGAALGGATGAVLGGATAKVGDMVANRATNKAIQNATPTLDDMRLTENNMFRSAYSKGASINAQNSDRLIKNLELSAGRINPNIRQRTAGVVDDLMAMRGKPLDPQALHEMRQQIQGELVAAEGGDINSLRNMLKTLDNFIEKNGNQQLKDAIAFSARRFKAEKLSELIDLADVKSARYSQSGMMNALRDKASQLYKQIVEKRVQGFTADEIATIRRLAKVETSSEATKWLAKFAPRGVMSMALGSGAGAGAGATIGGMIGGPAGAAAGAAIGAGATGGIGALAARSADKASTATINQLLGNTLRGPNFVAPQITNRLAPIAPATAIPGSELIRRQTGLATLKR